MVIGIFSHFFAVETTLAERQFFRALAKLIGRRAARLSACGIAAIVSRMGYLEEGCSVGADGSLYNVSLFTICVYVRAIVNSHCLSQKYPGFADRIHEGLFDIFGEKGRYVATEMHLFLVFCNDCPHQQHRHPSRRRWQRSWERDHRRQVPWLAFQTSLS